MAQSPGLWKLARRLPLLDKPDDRQVGLWVKAGPESIVVFNDEALRCALSRADFSLTWEGSVLGSLLGWADETRFLMRVGKTGRSVGPWDASKCRVVWKARGDGRPWGDAVAVVTPEGDLELRRLSDGEVTRKSSLGGGTTGPLLVAGDVLLRIVDDLLTGVELTTGSELWRTSLPDIFSGLPQGRVALRTLIAAGRGKVLVRFHTNYAMLDTLSGDVSWRRFVPSNHLPVVAEERVAFLFGRQLLLLKQATGEVVVDAQDAAPTLWESQPCAIGNLMIVVDQGGVLVTVDLHEGRVIGVQTERGAQFSRCACVDGRVLASGMDGALWVFERREQGGGPGAGGAGLPASRKRSKPGAHKHK